MPCINSLIVLDLGITNPYMNLAIEEYLIDSLNDDEKILFLWQNDNSLIVGNNQSVFSQCNVDRAKKMGTNIVRRSSGGGTVYHDLGNLNFSFLSKEKEDSFDLNYSILINCLNKMSISAEKTGRNDIFVGGMKVSGNAFLCKGEAVCHHGTLLISSDLSIIGELIAAKKKDSHVNEIDSVRSRVANLINFNPNISVSMVKRVLGETFEETYHIKARYIYDEEVFVADKPSINTLFKKYKSDDFIYGKEKCCEKTETGSFFWGQVSVSLNIVNGMITDCSILTDSLETDLIKDLENRLKNLEYSQTSIHNIIEEMLRAYSQNSILLDLEKIINKF